MPALIFRAQPSPPMRPSAKSRPMRLPGRASSAFVWFPDVLAAGAGMAHGSNDIVPIHGGARPARHRAAGKLPSGAAVFQPPNPPNHGFGKITRQGNASKVRFTTCFVSATQQKIPLRVLIIEDSEFDARILVSTLKQGGYQPSFLRVETAETLRAALANETWDIILSDYNMPSFSAPAALKIVQDSGLDLPFIIISGGIGEDVAVAAMKAGANDYLMKGNLARLAPAVDRELREAAIRAARRHAEEALRESEQRYRLLWENSTDAMVLINADGVIQFANPAAEEIFDWIPNEVVGHNFEMLLAERAREQYREWSQRFWRSDASKARQQPTVTVGRKKDGAEIFI